MYLFKELCQSYKCIDISVTWPGAWRGKTHASSHHPAIIPQFTLW